ncbi:hypothetical protein ACQPYE_24970 [Actinosynnema sp. CA-299493]
MRSCREPVLTGAGIELAAAGRDAVPPDPSAARVREATKAGTRGSVLPLARALGRKVGPT